MDNKKSFFKPLFNGILTENPTFIQVLGMCPTLAVTTSVENGIGMGLATTAVLIFSNLFISILRNIIPGKVRIAAYVVIIAGFVSLVDMILAAFVPSLSNSLGLYIPLIVVNCIILARAESFASKNGPVTSMLDGLGAGLGFTLALVIIASVREILGNGTWLGLKVMPAAFKPALIMILPVGGFLSLGFLMAGVQYLLKKKGAGK